ncbi:hypothetical protein DPE44_16680 [Salmonella enterica subsp. salamae]|nr:hypothetical protein [Salmonella enterica subsp. salamae]EAM5462145.1 hypothetical protein [Salmonella enterica]ECC9705630.1 hypothetical protein [Salmonella enterica subsp. salamae]
MQIKSRPPGRLFYAPYRALPHPIASFSHSRHKIGLDNTYGWRRDGRDNMTTIWYMATKKMPAPG